MPCLFSFEVRCCALIDNCAVVCVVLAVGSDLLADSSQIAMLSSVSLSRAKTKTVCKMAARFPGMSRRYMSLY